MITIDDVAKYCGVSSMTVSRVINDRGYVADKTRQLVNEAIKELNYRPNLLARSLVISKTFTVGVLMTRLENPIYSLIASGLTQEAVKNDYDIILSTSSDVNSSLKSINTLINKQIDALIVLPMEIREKISSETEDYRKSTKGIDEFYDRLNNLAKELENGNFPIVKIGRYRRDNGFYYVNEDYKAGAKLAVEHLVKNGHKGIGFLYHKVIDEGLWADRYHGFHEAMEVHGRQVLAQNMEPCVDTVESGYKAMKKLLLKCKDMTAVYCANDIIAAGAANAVLRQGLKIPEDISIIGHDGSVFSEAIYPRLTTVSIKPYEIGKQAFLMAKNVIDGKYDTKEIVVYPKVIEGKSVKKLKYIQ